MNEAQRAPAPEFYAIGQPFDSGWLAVSDIHSIYYEQSGNPNGTPVVFIHGGPGDGTRPTNRRFYDPVSYRIILYDQRGAGRSIPAANIRDNTTQHLIDDLERLRVHLGIDRWVVTGGSWGSCLGVLYAIHHAAQCRGLVLRGIFMGRPHEIEWWFHGRQALFPECHVPFREFIPADEREDLLNAYHRRLIDPDPSIHMPAAINLRVFSFYMRKLVVTEDPYKLIDPAQALVLSRLWTHYGVNGFFIEPNFILQNAERLRDIPGIIIQGRYDVVTPFMTAWDLHKAWPEAEFVVVPDGGHGSDDPAIGRAITEANHRMLERLR
jgi:proline iminopeptidase